MLLYLRKSISVCFCFLLIASLQACANAQYDATKPTVGDYQAVELLHQDDFEGELDQWQVEQGPGGTTQIKDGRLDIVDASGCTVWFKHKLKAPVLVEFDVVMISAGGKHDRVSDLNSFMMAIDPKNDDLLAGGEQRRGKFKNYDSLRLYYVGYGANGNKTVRFRRYPGDGTKPLLPDHDLEAKNKPNVKRRVQIIVVDGTYQY